MEHIMTEAQVEAYVAYLRAEEKSDATVRKYQRCLRQLLTATEGGTVSKDIVIARKADRLKRESPSSVNGALAAWNGFFRWLGWLDCCVKPVRIQRELFLRREKELTREEYFRLLKAAKQMGKQQLYYILQTVCATGIRISELSYITMEAVYTGKTRIRCKGKIRTVLLPRQLCRILKNYCREYRITQGSVFVTHGGKPVDRSNIWRGMKALCDTAGVDPEKVFPHNLRHLFARCFYEMERDLDALAAVLGHSNINTTRIYTMSTDRKHRDFLERLRLTC